MEEAIFYLRTTAVIFVIFLALTAQPISAEEIVDERAFTDRILFVVTDSSDLRLPEIEIISVGEGWAARSDVTNPDGEWSISRTWLSDTEKLLFCWPDGRFECAVITVGDPKQLSRQIDVMLPEPVMAHRYVVHQAERKD